MRRSSRRRFVPSLPRPASAVTAGKRPAASCVSIRQRRCPKGASPVRHLFPATWTRACYSKRFGAKKVSRRCRPTSRFRAKSSPTSPPGSKPERSGPRRSLRFDPNNIGRSSRRKRLSRTDRKRSRIRLIGSLVPDIRSPTSARSFAESRSICSVSRRHPKMLPSISPTNHLMRLIGLLNDCLRRRITARSGRGIGSMWFATPTLPARPPISRPLTLGGIATTSSTLSTATSRMTSSSASRSRGIFSWGRFSTCPARIRTGRLKTCPTSVTRNSSPRPDISASRGGLGLISMPIIS